MANHPRRAGSSRPYQTVGSSDTAQLPREYLVARRLAARGRYEKARRLYAGLESNAVEARLRALIGNDLAVLAAMAGELEAACRGLEVALAIDSGCQPSRLNLALLGAELGEAGTTAFPAGGAVTAGPPPPSSAVKVAILSFLFNWPSSGGGNIHTVELARFLAGAGYEVRHIYACYPGWEIGRVEDELPITSEALEFDEASWDVTEIQGRFRRAVDAIAPDYVLITDAWNMKPLLAEAVRRYPYLMRFQA
jgi:hypothetical protein